MGNKDKKSGFDAPTIGRFEKIPDGYVRKKDKNGVVRYVKKKDKK